MARSSLREQLDQARGVIEVLRAENEELRAHVNLLVGRIDRLRSDSDKDSTTSSKPPSTDPVATRQSRAERRAAGRGTKRKTKQGKQPGAPGAHLKRRTPDRVITHDPHVCHGCGADLADAAVVGRACRQVIDLPEIRPIVVDHVVSRRRCGCGTETTAAFPDHARAAVCWGPEVRALAVYLLCRQHLPVERTAELLAGVVGAPVSTGWLCDVQGEAARKLVPFTTRAVAELRAAPVVHADETGTRIKTTKAWVHTVTTEAITLLTIHPKRGAAAMTAAGVLPDFTGTIVHDGFSSYDTFGQATHAQCGAHLLRHLAGISEDPRFANWTKTMTGILLEAKTVSENAAAHKQRKVDPVTTANLKARYHNTLDDAFDLLPPGHPPPKTSQPGWDTAQRKTFNLATRLTDHADDVLRLLTDTRIPFDNNTAERALRMVKLHDKISGCFHSLTGAQNFATTRSYLQTADHHHQNLLQALRQLFTTGPWLPPHPTPT